MGGGGGGGLVSFPLYHKVAAELEGLAGKGIVLAQDDRGFKNLNQKKTFARNFDERFSTFHLIGLIDIIFQKSYFSFLWTRLVKMLPIYGLSKTSPKKFCR